jgi:hypothetical protein
MIPGFTRMMVFLANPLTVVDNEMAKRCEARREYMREWRRQKRERMEEAKKGRCIRHLNK